MKTALQLIESCQGLMKSLASLISIKEHQNRLAEIDELSNQPDFWACGQSSVKLMKERTKLSDLLASMNNFEQQFLFLEEAIKELPKDEEYVLSELEKLELEMSSFEFKQMMKDPLDDNNAILTISSGAGGLEAKNWVSMLMRMYLRFAERQGFKTEILDLKESEEHSDICIDNVSLLISGDYAYGWLKKESGVHRLVRRSPFNSDNARHTSFAAISIEPDIEDIIDINIEDKDLEVKATLSGGNGGQNVAKTKSCIIMKHLPSGIQIRSQSERSQHENRRIALKRLKARLYNLELNKRREEQDANAEQLLAVSFGSQIKTYTLDPYELIVDHRTKFKTNQVKKFLDGNILESLKINQ